MQHANFVAEAHASGKEEYGLLRHDYDSASDVAALKGIVTLAEADRTFRLEASFVPDPAIDNVYSAHTNKRRYLSSHLYTFLDDIEPGETRTLTVSYALSSTE